MRGFWRATLTKLWLNSFMNLYRQDLIELFFIFYELLQSLDQALENKFGKVINRDIQRITATHCTSQAFDGNFYVLLPHSRQKESHSQRNGVLPRSCMSREPFLAAKRNWSFTILIILLTANWTCFVLRAFCLALGAFWSLWYAVLSYANHILQSVHDIPMKEQVKTT